MSIQMDTFIALSSRTTIALAAHAKLANNTTGEHWCQRTPQAIEKPSEMV